MEFSPENRLRTERLLLFCWQEQLIDRGCLVKCLLALEDSDDESCMAALKAALPNSVLADTHRKVAGYASATEQLLEQLQGVKPEKISLSQPLAAALPTPSLQPAPLPEISNVAMVPEPPPEAPAGGSADLQVSMLPRFVGPITALLLIILGCFVFGAFQSVSDYFTAEKPETSPQDQITGTSNTAGGAVVTPDETTLEVVPTPQTGISTKLDLRDALDRLIPGEQWQEISSDRWQQAIDVLNSPRYRQRDQNSTLWEATVLAGTGDQQNIDDALRMICARTNIQSSDPTWLQLYAMLLLSASEKARELATDSISQSSGRAMQLPQTLRILDWAASREGKSEADLNALRKRLADFTADSLDHFFLAYANLSDKNKEQASYHIKRARQHYLADYVPDEDHPKWLTGMCDKRLLEAIDKLRERVEP
jgi:hypothetical protein